MCAHQEECRRRSDYVSTFINVYETTPMILASVGSSSDLVGLLFLGRLAMNNSAVNFQPPQDAL